MAEHLFVGKKTFDLRNKLRTKLYDIIANEVSNS